MSDRIDTDAVRRDLRAGEHRGMGTILALCDEVDRLRGALRDARVITSKDYISVGRAGLIVQMGEVDDILRAALAESGDTERPATMDTGLVEVRQVRCPTCGSDDPYRQGIVGEKWEPLTNEGGQWWQVLCNDHWHSDLGAEK